MQGVGILGVQGINLLWLILIGILAGFIAEKVMNRNHGLLTNLIVGLIGALIGPSILGALGLMPAGRSLVVSLVVATIGAVVLLFLLSLIRRRW
ncbi:GlsB/YeaQ/YmgE family stress response membrane protein [Chelatococcus daeguensis]|uniref:GlsB/YeaQ/YmgE family stress response membrane protein n=2 Tax=Chelatococcus daeguensis TaxID=444444 RepID=A0AAC9NYV7_9HYPH|nr:GlsB/YeaQ/YmgE family stress response membrane protein [Chelatococcus daeguensis]APF37523.1 hypothetical protein BOQ54_09405 [Chelatococcus daeguensis]KZE35457.1 hypothetical protein AVW15_14495 [Chelatococcus daeguensis]MBM3085447.1 GlsB/YeaQ/YmgE family stress response membrane protein [Chelatococcus daeguensis]